MVYLTWKYKSFKYLCLGKKRIAGRNNSGKIVNYHRGGGSKKKSRLVDYKRYIWNIYGFVIRFEYDPNRTAILALISYSNGLISYILAPQGLCIGDKIISKDFPKTFPGNSSLLENMPVGVRLNCLEYKPGSGAKVARSAGTFVTIVKKDLENFYSIIKLKSGELRKFSNNCVATFGYISNFEFIFKKFLKAGYYRRKGWRPIVRGVAMNPVDHPHGGGQGKTSGGRPSVTRYGIITKGKPTRSKNSLNNINIVKRR